MPFNASDYRPVASNWYCGSGTYEGTAILSVAGVEKASGPAEVAWNDLGETMFSMDLPPSKFNLAHELFGEEAIYIRLVTPNGGVFIADRAFATHNKINVTGGNLRTRIKLTAARSSFVSSEAKCPTYWIMSAINLAAEMYFSSPSLAKHPLRIYTPSVVPGGLDPHDRIVAEAIASEQERLIPFSFEGKPAFIERLPEYGERIQALKEKRVDHQTTAIIVGDVPEGARFDTSGLISWLPTDIFYALGIATGTCVGWGMIEFRSDDGTLVSRIHMSARCPAYREGASFIEDPICMSGQSAYAELIERALATFPHKKYLRGVANNIISGSQHDLIEDSADAYVRALEALTKAAGVSRQDLLAGVPDVVRQKVLSVLTTAEAEIKAAAAAARENGDIATFNRLTTIAARSRSAGQVESKFGLAVSSLVLAAGLCDEAIVNLFLEAKTPPNTWVDFLSQTRGAVIHEGMIDLPTRKSLLELHSLLRHLGDVLLRLFAFEVGYTGKYLPRVAKWARESRDLRWVNESTKPIDLLLH